VQYRIPLAETIELGLAEYPEPTDGIPHVRIPHRAGRMRDGAGVRLGNQTTVGCVRGEPCLRRLGQTHHGAGTADPYYISTDTRLHVSGTQWKMTVPLFMKYASGIPQHPASGMRCSTSSNPRLAM